MSWQPSPAAAAPVAAARPGRTMIVIGAVLLAVATVLGIVSVVQVVASVGRPLADAMQNPAYDTPADFTMKLDAATYTVYASTVNDRASVGVDDISITGPDGQDVAVDGAASSVETIGRGSTTYVGAARFQAPAAGSYKITVARQPNAVVVVAPSIQPSLEEVGYWVLGIVGAGLLGLLGLVLLIVGLVRRSSARKQAAFAGQGYPGQGYPGQGYPGQGYPGQGYPGHPDRAYPGQAYPQQGQPQQGQPYAYPQQPERGAGPDHPPAGWYPDPGTPGKSRYWDGGTWTDHQR